MATKADPKKRQIPSCQSCSSRMAEVYELDIPVYRGNVDTRVRNTQRAYVCHGCLTTACTFNGAGAIRAAKGKKIAEAHPRLLEMLSKVVKGIRAAK